MGADAEASLVRQCMGEHCTRKRARVETIGNLLRDDNGRQRVDLLLLQAMGSELNVLLGARRVLHRICVVATTIHMARASREKGARWEAELLLRLFGKPSFSLVLPSAGRLPAVGVNDQSILEKALERRNTSVFLVAWTEYRSCNAS